MFLITILFVYNAFILFFLIITDVFLSKSLLIYLYAEMHKLVTYYLKF